TPGDRRIALALAWQSLRYGKPCTRQGLPSWRTGGARPPLANPRSGTLEWGMLSERSTPSRGTRLSVRLLLTTLVVCAMPSMGLADQSKPDAAATIRKTLEARYPGTHVLDVQPSAMA